MRSRKRSGSTPPRSATDWGRATRKPFARSCLSPVALPLWCGVSLRNGLLDLALECRCVDLCGFEVCPDRLQVRCGLHDQQFQEALVNPAGHAKGEGKEPFSGRLHFDGDLVEMLRAAFQSRGERLGIGG